MSKHLFEKGNMLQLRHGWSYTPTYKSWLSMRARCLNKSDAAYQAYGGRGIRICSRWSVFENFLHDMGARPEETTLDRFPDNDGNYEPGNCRWATDVMQNRNRSTVPLIEIDGAIKRAPEWAEIFNIGAGRAARRMKAGWDAKSAFTVPVRAKRG